jgi:hypothetical protein
MGRLLGRVVILLVVLPAASATSASAATRMYVSTARAADGTASVSGYAFDGLTQIVHDFRLDVARGGTTVATDTASGFVLVAPATLRAGDELTLTDVDTAATHTATFTGNPTLAAPTCGAAAFSGTRDDGATVDVSVAGQPTVEVSGGGTGFAGSFASALSLGASVQASQGRVVSAGFTVFDAVTAAVGGTCPVAAVAAVAETPAAAAAAVVPAPVVAPPAPAPAPAPAPTPALAPISDTVAPLGRATVRAALLKPATAYKALIAGTFSASVTVSEPGTITQTLAAGRTKLATVSKRIAKAGTVKVTLKVAKRRLTATRTVKLTLTTTLRDPAGNVRTLAPAHFTARR